MKNPEYNLLDEPWIPVRLLDGTIADVGLLELLRRTTDIADLACRRRASRSSDSFWPSRIV